MNSKKIDGRYAKESARLRYSIANAGQSKDALAVQLHSTKSNLYNWTSENKPHFPDPFQLDLLCRCIDADPWYILTGEYEDQILRHLSGLSHRESLAARGLLANYLMMVLSVPGVQPDLVRDDEPAEHEVAVEQARERFRFHIDQRFGRNGLNELGDMLDLRRKVRRWFRSKNPEGFPDSKSFVQLCEALDIKFGDIIRNDPTQDFERLLGGFDKKEMKAAKELAASTMRRLYR